MLNTFAIDWLPGNSSIANVTWSGTTAYLNFVGYGSTNIDTTAHDCVYQYNCQTDQCDCTVTPLPVQQQVQARARQPKYVAVIGQEDKTGFCSSALKERDYRALDDVGWLDGNLHWVMNETVTSQNGQCGTIGIGSNVIRNGFTDVIMVGCNTACVFQTDQTYSLGLASGGPVSQVPGKNCIGISDSATCRARPSLTGWHVSASSTSTSVTDKP